MWKNISCVCKEELVIPDDLPLKKKFLDCVEVPVFVWIPKSSSMSSILRRHVEIYDSLGINKVSKSVECNVSNMQTLENSEKADM